MFYNAKNKVVKLDDCTIDYITFGSGKENLIFIPGVGDGLKTVKGLALPFAFMYKMFAKDFKVYVFSRRNNLPKGFSTLDMANDIVKSMDVIGIEKAHVVGVSQGGMIAQYLSINNPTKIEKLVLAITSSRPNGLMRESIETWIDLLNKDDFKNMMIDNAKRSYVGKYLNKMLSMINHFSFLMKPKSYERFIIQSESCLNHNAFEELSNIQNKTLVIGAGLDGILGVNASYEIYEKIKDSEIYIFDEYSHGVYDQTDDFNKKIFEFLIK
jgi:pimeloyl-ACP methyl ester carboxylesterase